MMSVIETTVASSRLAFAVTILAISLILSNVANGQTKAAATTPSPPKQESDNTEIPKALLGDWSLDLDNDLPAWMSIAEEDGKPIVRMRLYVGGLGPYKNAKIEDGRVKFSIVKKAKRKNATNKSSGTVTLVNVGIKDGSLDGSVEKQVNGQEGKQVAFTGTKIPPMQTTSPDLAKVKFGERVTLFNGKDLTGWTPHEKDKKMGWSVVDGLLQNDTPKTDFSATGAYANLKTTDNYEDFRLHIEFKIGTQRNSGVYLRGMYEVQVVDRDSRMQGIQGVGAVFAAVAPSSNAGKVGGQWQTYDLTLVDRHITVVLNGETVVDNQPVPQPTPGAIHTNPATAGPIYLQGDHTSVAYRNIYLEPVIKE